MPLNLTVNDGDITPYLKYNAKAGRFYVRPQGAQQDVEIISPRLAFDMANIKTGWIFYQEGVGPEKVWDASPDKASPRPAGPRKFKRGFEVMVFGGDDLPGVGKLGLREFSSTATNVIAAILKMHAEYEAGLPANPGRVPFYACTRVLPVQGAYGTNYEPEFVLKGWVERSKIPAFDEHQTDGNGLGDAWETQTDPLNNAVADGPPPGHPAALGGGVIDDTIPFAAETR